MTEQAQRGPVLQLRGFQLQIVAFSLAGNRTRSTVGPHQISVSAAFTPAYTLSSKAGRTLAAWLGSSVTLRQSCAVCRKSMLSARRLQYRHKIPPKSRFREKWAQAIIDPL
jgi:hypothetical protein